MLTSVKETPQVSMQDIAQKAGVTRATVSLALRNHPRLSPETRQRIQQIAREIGYRPDATVSTIMTRVRARQRTRQTTTLAFITAFPTRDGWRRTSFLFTEFFEGACERANELGFRMDEIWAKQPGMTGQRLTGILLARGIRGILVASLARSRGHLTLDWSQFAATTFGPSLWRPYLHRATNDHFNDFVMVLRNLRKRGYRRIGLVAARLGEERVNYAHAAALYRYHQELSPNERIRPLLYPRSGLTEAQCRKWFQRYHPDVVIGYPGLLAWLRNWRVRVPQAVGFFSLGWRPGDPFAGLNQNGKLIGVAAVDLVVAQLHRNERGIPTHPRVLVVHGEWGDGPTLRPAT